MNYAAHYERLIARARGRSLIGYKERHHILPRCMGGGNGKENLVDLTAEEHYVAHQLLVKMHPDIDGLKWAAIRQAKHANGNKAYGWLRRLHGAVSSKRRKGTKASPETRAKLSAMRIGKPGTTTGRKFSRSKEFSEKMSSILKGRTITPEWRAKISAAKTGKKCTAEHRAKVSASLIGNRRACGHVFSEEQRQNVSKGLRSMSAEDAARMKQNHQTSMQEIAGEISERQKTRHALGMFLRDPRTGRIVGHKAAQGA